MYWQTRSPITDAQVSEIEQSLADYYSLSLNFV